VKLRQAAIYPRRYALFFAVIYTIFALIWIRYSTNLVGYISTSVQESERLELYKGYGFISFTGLLFFFFSLAVFRKMATSSRSVLESQHRLVQAERDSISGLLASSVAHDITNLTTILQLNTERISRVPELPAPARDSVERLERAVLRMIDLTKRMRNAGRNGLKERPRTFDLRETIDETLTLIAGHQNVKGCAIQVVGDIKIQTCGYPILVHQLLINLILNAAEATSGRGRILIRALHVSNGITLEISDDGPGISESARDKVFEAFYTTKPNGTGLGLMSVKSCVEIYGGTVSIRESEMGGATFYLELPDLSGGQIAAVKQAKSLNKTRATPPQSPWH
jgi:signal transduction histidine kinase